MVRRSVNVPISGDDAASESSLSDLPDDPEEGMAPPNDDIQMADPKKDEVLHDGQAEAAGGDRRSPSQAAGGEEYEVLDDVQMEAGGGEHPSPSRPQVMADPGSPDSAMLLGDSDSEGWNGISTPSEGAPANSIPKKLRIVDAGAL